MRRELGVWTANKTKKAEAATVVVTVRWDTSEQARAAREDSRGRRDPSLREGFLSINGPGNRSDRFGDVESRGFVRGGYGVLEGHVLRLVPN